MTACALCDPKLEPILATSDHWRLVLNWNQDLLGKCFLVAQRHVESLVELTVAEWAELQRQLQLATARLVAAFAPAHFNYAFLQNQDRHVHVHIIPRYGEARAFGGDRFVDTAYPGHYAVPGEPKHLSAVQFAALTDRLARVRA